MKTKINMTDMSEKQRQVWLMRYRYGWRMKKIARKLGISQPAATALVLRAERRAGLFRTGRVRIIRTKPRRCRARSLSLVYEY